MQDLRRPIATAPRCGAKWSSDPPVLFGSSKLVSSSSPFPQLTAVAGERRRERKREASQCLEALCEKEPRPRRAINAPGESERRQSYRTLFLEKRGRWPGFEPAR